MGLEAGASRSDDLLAALVETTKPRITRLVTTTTVVGFAMAGVDRSWHAGQLALAAIGCVVCTAMTAAGANALNQYIERDRDGRMPRTAARPLVTGRATPDQVLALGTTLALVGLAGLWACNGPVPALIALATIASYLFLYTPLKPVTPLSTVVGAIPGALPPLIGWAAASEAGGPASLLERGGWSLFALMFAWQLPHFFAIAWMYREDYARGGYRMLPAIDPTGRLTSWTILVTAVLLIPLTLWPAWAMPSLLGPVYITVAAASGVWYVLRAFAFVATRERAEARRVFIASIIHLPLLLVVMVGEALVRTIMA